MMATARRSNRSTRAPAIGPRIRSGSNRVSSTPDTAAPWARFDESLVRYAASAVVASRPSQSPRLEIAMADQSRRKTGMRSSTATELGPRLRLTGSAVSLIRSMIFCTAPLAKPITTKKTMTAQTLDDALLRAAASDRLRCCAWSRAVFRASPRWVYCEAIGAAGATADGETDPIDCGWVAWKDWLSTRSDWPEVKLRNMAATSAAVTVRPWKPPWLAGRGGTGGAGEYPVAGRPGVDRSERTCPPAGRTAGAIAAGVP